MLEEEFNDDFVNVLHSRFESYARNFLGSPSKKTIFKNLPNENGIARIFSAIYNSKSSEVEEFQIKPLNCVAYILSPAICTFIICHSLPEFFLKKWKKAKVIVIYKSEYNNNFFNYRPISMLAVF